VLASLRSPRGLGSEMVQLSPHLGCDGMYKSKKKEGPRRVEKGREKLADWCGSNERGDEDYMVLKNIEYNREEKSER